MKCDSTNRYLYQYNLYLVLTDTYLELRNVTKKISKYNLRLVLAGTSLVLCRVTQQISICITRMERMYLSNTTLFVGRGMQIIYYIRYNYMFRLLIT